MSKILGIDLGTNSIGLSVRDTELIENSNNIEEQLTYFQSVIFPSGVGKEKKVEFSFAAERTKKRSPRHLIWARKCRIWATLELLINNGYCPLSIKDLDKWRKYDKEKGLFRQYPIEAEKFEQWVRLDFNGDGTPDYSSPYQLRAELMTRQFDFNVESERFKLGRALYHIAQRRGFKSSKGETLANQEKESDPKFDEEQSIDLFDSLKKSEEDKSNAIVKYMKEHNLKTIGCAFAKLEKDGIRVRNSIYSAVRSQYKAEINEIFNFQNGLDTNSNFYNSLISEKKDIGTIFYKRPLKSQKGLVGKCTLEPSKSRCAISHPDFEKYRAWCLINNIQIKRSQNNSWEFLPIELKERLYNEVFLSSTSSSFPFSKIKNWLEKNIKCKLEQKQQINYSDKTIVSACPVSASLKKLLGENYETATIEVKNAKLIKKTGEIRNCNYNYIDIWHYCFTCDDLEYIQEFAQKLQLNDLQTKALGKIWSSISQGYSNLSIKAIKNITKFLQKGLIYSDAVFLAKLPEIFKDKWEENEQNIIKDLDTILLNYKKEKEYKSIANSLIAKYKSLELNEQFANHNPDYILQDSDHKDIMSEILDFFGEKTFSNKTKKEQSATIEIVTNLYQEFFSQPNHKREYYKLPKQEEWIKNYLLEKYTDLNPKDLDKIYHPSMMEIYPKSKAEYIDGIEMRLLKSPTIGAIKNPLVMRVLHILKNKINELIKAQIIDSETRIIVELARDVVDKNMRSAIDQYDSEKAKETQAIIDAIKEFKESDEEPTKEEIEKVKLWGQQSDIIDSVDYKGLTDNQIKNLKEFKADIDKYRLWKEQKYRCIYTGNVISLSDLFAENRYDFEHTIPRSISFDNSLSNLTICEANFNRNTKKNQIPSQLPNYEKILERIQPWIDKVEQLKEHIKVWKAKAKKAATKKQKDTCIVNRHILEFELEYWRKKVKAFTDKEYKSGFRNSQLNDTRIISKYAFHYLKSVFDRVEVQKGEVTSIFRKLLGIQRFEQQKNRDKHAHHAIDATILTLIPTPAKRESILKLYYEKEEEYSLYGNSAKHHSLNNELISEVRKLGLKNCDTLKEFIEETILINHVSKDQTLTPVSKRKRVKGKIVPLKDENDNIIFEKDKDGNLKLNKFGHPIPVAKQKIKGDCIRGQLHEETFYGAIKLAKKDENGNFLRDDSGKMIQEDKITYVVRRELKAAKSAIDTGFKNWDDLGKAMVDQPLFAKMKAQFPDGTSLKEAIESGIWQTNKDGVKINRIRHIRCKAAVSSPLSIKRQTYPSKWDYKNNYYAKVGEIYCMCEYKDENSSKKINVVYNKFNISDNKKNIGKFIPDFIEHKNKKLKLERTLYPGLHVLLYEKNKEEVVELDKKDLSKILYLIKRFEGDGRIHLLHHLCALESKELGDGEPIKNYNSLPIHIRMSRNKLKFLIEHEDFEFSADGGIEFK